MLASQHLSGNPYLLLLPYAIMPFFLGKISKDIEWVLLPQSIFYYFIVYMTNATQKCHHRHLPSTISLFFPQSLTFTVQCSTSSRSIPTLSGIQRTTMNHAKWAHPAIEYHRGVERKTLQNKKWSYFLCPLFVFASKSMVFVPYQKEGGMNLTQRLVQIGISKFWAKQKLYE